MMQKFTLISLIIMLLSLKNQQSAFAQQDIEKKIDALLATMSTEEKIGQTAQITIDVILDKSKITPGNHHLLDPEKLKKALGDYKIGSILNISTEAFTRKQWLEIMTSIKTAAEKYNLRIPVIYGIDAVHGAGYTIDATLFPQQIAMAATRNLNLTEKAAAITAYETRASYIPWNFSPVLDVSRNPLWPRIWESFGEDVFLTRKMGVAMLKGYQGTDISDKTKVAVSLKHYMGYGAPVSGKDRTPAWIPEHYLREYYLPPFADAVKNQAATVMVNSSEINGKPVHADKYLITDVLKKELKFDGFVVSDWEDIKYLHTRHRIAPDVKEAVRLAIDAGIDMSMIPNDFEYVDLLKQLVNEGKIPMTRIDDAVRRILRIKYRLGLFENMFYAPENYPLFGSEEHKKINLETAREAITLLKNEGNILPLSGKHKILVTGISANSVSLLNGGWTYTWQGINADKVLTNNKTVFSAIKELNGSSDVTLCTDNSFESPTKIAEAVTKAKNSDLIILCAGEHTYTEKPGDIEDLYISDGQTCLAEALAATGKPVILVLIEGRPRIISKFEHKMKAVIMSYLPGNEGGQAIAEVIFGKTNPSGKLPFTYPRYPNSLVTYDHKFTEDLDGNTFNPQYHFGFGLSYTTFEYSDLAISKTTVNINDTVEISVNIKNTGKIRGKETVHLFVSDRYASLTPPVKRLRGFEKIDLIPGEIRNVKFRLPLSELAFINTDNKPICEPGEFDIYIDKLKLTFNVK